MPLSRNQYFYYTDINRAIPYGANGWTVLGRIPDNGVYYFTKYDLYMTVTGGAKPTITSSVAYTTSVATWSHPYLAPVRATIHLTNKSESKYTTVVHTAYPYTPSVDIQDYQSLNFTNEFDDYYYDEYFTIYRPSAYDGDILQYVTSALIKVGWREADFAQCVYKSHSNVCTVSIKSGATAVLPIPDTFRHVLANSSYVSYVASALRGSLSTAAPYLAISAIKYATNAGIGQRVFRLPPITQAYGSAVYTKISHLTYWPSGSTHTFCTSLDSYYGIITVAGSYLNLTSVYSVSGTSNTTFIESIYIHPPIESRVTAYNTRNSTPLVNSSHIPSGYYWITSRNSSMPADGWVTSNHWIIATFAESGPLLLMSMTLNGSYVSYGSGGLYKWVGGRLQSAANCAINSADLAYICIALPATPDAPSYAVADKASVLLYETCAVPVINYTTGAAYGKQGAEYRPYGLLVGIGSNDDDTCVRCTPHIFRGANTWNIRASLIAPIGTPSIGSTRSSAAKYSSERLYINSKDYSSHGVWSYTGTNYRVDNYSQYGRWLDFASFKEQSTCNYQEIIQSAEDLQSAPQVYTSSAIFYHSERVDTWYKGSSYYVSDSAGSVVTGSSSGSAGWISYQSEQTHVDMIADPTCSAYISMGGAWIHGDVSEDSQILSFRTEGWEWRYSLAYLHHNIARHPIPYTNTDGEVVTGTSPVLHIPGSVYFYYPSGHRYVIGSIGTDTKGSYSELDISDSYDTNYSWHSSFTSTAIIADGYAGLYDNLPADIYLPASPGTYQIRSEITIGGVGRVSYDVYSMVNYNSSAGGAVAYAWGRSYASLVYNHVGMNIVQSTYISCYYDSLLNIYRVESNVLSEYANGSTKYSTTVATATLSGIFSNFSKKAQGYLAALSESDFSIDIDTDVRTSQWSSPTHSTSNDSVYDYGETSAYVAEADYSKVERRNYSYNVTDMQIIPFTIVVTVNSV